MGGTECFIDVEIVKENTTTTKQTIFKKCSGCY